VARASDAASSCAVFRRSKNTAQSRESHPTASPGATAGGAPPPPQCRQTRTRVVWWRSRREAREESTAAASWGLRRHSSQRGWAACVSRSHTCGGKNPNLEEALLVWGVEDFLIWGGEEMRGAGGNKLVVSEFAVDAHPPQILQAPVLYVHFCVH